MDVALILADFAESDSVTGKVHVLGAGWSVTGPAPSPQAIVAFLKVPPDRVREPIQFTVRLFEQGGQLVKVPGLGGMQPLEISGQIDMQIPSEWDNASDLSASFSVNIGVLPLKPGSSYSWVVEIDGKEEARTGFLMRADLSKDKTVPS